MRKPRTAAEAEKQAWLEIVAAARNLAGQVRLHGLPRFPHPYQGEWFSRLLAAVEAEPAIEQYMAIDAKLINPSERACRHCSSTATHPELEGAI